MPRKDGISIRVTSNGVDGLVITSDGNKLEDVVGVTVTMGVREPTHIDLEMIAIPIDIEGEVDEVRLECNLCGHNTGHYCRETV